MFTGVKVAVDNAAFQFDKLYSYNLPQQLQPYARIGARVLVPFDRRTGIVRGSVRRGPLVVDVEDRGLLPLPLEHEGKKLLWRHMIGSPGDAELRVEAPSMGDAGSYFFYVGKVVYRLPLASAKGAMRLGVYGRMLGHRKTREPEGLCLSSDGETWQKVADPWGDSRNTCYSIAIPDELRGGSSLSRSERHSCTSPSDQRLRSSSMLDACSPPSR